jgi:vesicle-associated membrane protein 4
MQQNIKKVAQRGERLDSLQDTTDDLSVSAKHFRRGTNRVRKLMWLKDMKIVLCLVIGVILVIAVFVSIVVTKR